MAIGLIALACSHSGTTTAANGVGGVDRDRAWDRECTDFSTREEKFFNTAQANKFLNAVRV